MTNDKYQQELFQLAKNHSVNKIKLNVFESLDSTNIKAWEFIKNNHPLPTAIIALQQTAGKGQWGKQWNSGLGGLYFSVALECDIALENSFHLIMATAVGITNILRTYQLPVSIKWLNDLLLEERKLGGIKIETKSKNQKIKYAVVGVGINWNNLVPQMGINLTSYYQKYQLKERNQNINSLEKLTAIAIIGLLQGYQDYLQLGSDHTLQKYQQLLNNIGKQVIINDACGTIVGVNAQGKLKVCFQSSGATTEIYLSPGNVSLGYK